MEMQFQTFGLPVFNHTQGLSSSASTNGISHLKTKTLQFIRSELLHTSLNMTQCRFLDKQTSVSATFTFSWYGPSTIHPQNV